MDNETTLVASRSTLATRNGRKPGQAGGGPLEVLSPGFPPSEVFCSASALKDVFQPGLSAGTRNELSSCSREGFGKYRRASMLATVICSGPSATFVISSPAPTSPSFSTRK